MADINRSLIIVTVKQPFLDWARSVDPEFNDSLEEINKDPTAYLVPEFETDDDQESIIEWCADFIFEQELLSWYTVEDTWPTDRNVAMFHEWFDASFHSIVNDVVGDVPLLHLGDDDDEEEDDEDDFDASSNGH